MSDISALIAALPECYQPIFGHPLQPGIVQRSCYDRLEPIRTVVQDLVAHYGRPLRILDLGSAQGFFTLSLAPYCEQAVGIDLDSSNVALSSALAREHDITHVVFREATVQDYIHEMAPGSFDVALGLSVFHHLCHSDGLAATRDLIEELASKVDVLLLELALNSEPLYWSEALPDAPESLVSSIAFVRCLGTFGTHLSETKRPLFYCSNRVWHFPRSTERFADWSIESHELAHGTHEDSRRYFVSTDRFAKTYQLTGPRRLTNKSEYDSEISSLSTLPGLGMASVEVPTLHDHGETDEYAYVVTDRIAGRRLSELLGLEDSLAVLPIVEAVFRQLAELESHGYYHNDLRVWNVLVDAQGQARLIDLGAITRDAKDVQWPYDLLAGALLFAIEVCRWPIVRANPFRIPLFAPVWVDGALHQWFNTVWETPRAAWCFRLFHELLLTAAATSSRIPLRTPAIPSENTVYWMGLIESLLYEASDAFPYREVVAWAQEVEAVAQRVEAKAQEAEIRTEEAEAQFAAAETRAQEAEAQFAAAETRAQEAEAQFAAAETRAQEAEAQFAAAETRAQEAEAQFAAAETRAQEAEAQFAAILRGASWRITRPLRWAKRAALRFARPWGFWRRARPWLKSRAKVIIGHPMRWLLARPHAGPVVDQLLAHVPAVDRRVRAAVREVSRSAIPTGPAGDTVPSDLEHLPVSAREVFADLERALERRGR
jgi:O-antigen chain-terminating methyltransferase